jgi:hypothetical protein
MAVLRLKEDIILNNLNQYTCKSCSFTIRARIITHELKHFPNPDNSRSRVAGEGRLPVAWLA